MAPLTVTQLRKCGLLELGNTFRCVFNPTSSDVFTVGETYDVYSTTHLCSNDGPQTSSISEFVLANDDTNEPEIVEEDLVANPAHYARFVIQPIEFLMKNRVEGHVFNIVKYVMRAGHKIYEGQTAEESEVIDLRKVISNAQRRINLIKGLPIV